MQLQLYSQVFDQKIIVGGGDESISVKIICSHPFEFNRKGVSGRSSVHWLSVLNYIFFALSPFFLKKKGRIKLGGV